MGLDFSHTDAQWAYSGFHRARVRLAYEIGINLNEMEGFSGFFGNLNDKSWDEIDDPIAPLLCHSDCDGELTPEECRSIAPRLRELVRDWPNDHDKQNFLMLAQGMDDAAEKNEPLEFC